MRITMLDTAPGMVALLNLERQIVFCNDAYAKAGGLARKEDALGMRPGESCRYFGLAQACWPASWAAPTRASACCNTTTITGTSRQLAGDTWTRHALPAGFQTETVQTSSLALLPDGRILVKTVRGDAILAMDPKTRRFTQFLHPEGRLISSSL